MCPLLRLSDLILKTSYLAMPEIGFKILFPSERSFYMGLFLDYGLNDLRENKGPQNVIANN